MLTLLNPFEVRVKFIKAALKLKKLTPAKITYGNKLLKEPLGNPRIVVFRATLPALLHLRYLGELFDRQLVQ